MTSSLTYALSQMEPPPFGNELEKRRAMTLDWLRFIRDFGHIDTSLLIERASTEDDFVEAIEAIVATGSTAAEAFDAIRSFAVQHLLSEEVTPKPQADPRISPFAVPLELLRAVFDLDNKYGFEPKRLRVCTFAETLHNDGADARRFFASNNTLTLLTTCWARVFPQPEKPVEGSLQLVQTAPNRCYDISLLAAVTDRVPLFLPFAPHDGYVLQPPRPIDVMIYVFLEGWSYEYG